MKIIQLVNNTKVSDSTILAKVAHLFRTYEVLEVTANRASEAEIELDCVVKYCDVELSVVEYFETEL